MLIGRDWIEYLMGIALDCEGKGLWLDADFYLALALSEEEYLNDQRLIAGDRKERRYEP